jgi:hypothetical protein
MSLFFEKYYPFLVALILSITSFIYGEIFCFEYGNFYNTSLSIFSILIGFLLTVSTIINTLDNDVVQFVKKSEKFHLFIRYLKDSIHSSLYSLIVIVLYILLKNTLQLLENYCNSIIVFIITYSLSSCFRFITIFIKIIIR